ncbi:hypothetical protein AgCh_018946 [Apium graveolens]
MMAEDQSVGGRRCIYYDHIIWTIAEEHGLSEQVLNVLTQFISGSSSEILIQQCLGPSEASIVQPEAQKKSSDDLAVLKEEVAQLMQRQTILLGNY